MATISTHNGSALSQAHNIRNEKAIKNQTHINRDGEFEVWKHETIPHAYKRIFGKAQEEYNAKQKRADRKIYSYYNKVKQDQRQHTAYEMIVGVYGADVSAETSKNILKEFCSAWKKRNPNLELIGAYYHADEEGSPHLHLDYIPVAHNYKKGMDTQAGLIKALGEQGFVKDGKLTAQILWEHRENKYLEELCIKRGIAVERPKRGLKHFNTKEYKILQEELKKVKQELVAHQEACIRLVEQNQLLQEQYEKNMAAYNAKIAQIDEIEKMATKTLGGNFKLNESDFKALIGRIMKADSVLKSFNEFEQSKNNTISALQRENELLKKEVDSAKTLDIENRIKLVDYDKMQDTLQRLKAEVPEVKEFFDKQKILSQRIKHNFTR